MNRIERKLRTYGHHILRIIASIQNCANQVCPLPSVINICSETKIFTVSKLFEFWSVSSSKLPSCEIALYDNENLPMNLFPSVPVGKFVFGRAATPPLVLLRSYGIEDLKFDTFHLREYDHYGTVRHAVTSVYYLDMLLIEDKHFSDISHLH